MAGSRLVRRSTALAALAAAGASLAAQGAHAASTCVTLTQDSGGEQDVMVLQSSPDTNYDDNSDLFTGVTKHNNQGYTLIRYDLSDIPSGAVITSAVLGITENNAALLGTVNAHQILGGWDASTATWADFTAGWSSTVLSSDASVVASPSSEAVLSFDITALTESWVNGSIANNGVLLEQGTGCTYYDNTIGPSLEVCYVDSCDPSPCVNGTCSSTTSGYACACAPGWIGANCDTSPYPASALVCGGTTAASTTYSSVLTVGEPGAGKASSSTYVLYGGFVGASQGP